MAEEGENGDFQEENILGSGNSRNTIRSLAFQSALRISDESLHSALFKTVYGVLKIVICVIVMNRNSTATEKPIKRFINMLIVSETMLVIRYMFRIMNVLTESVTRIALIIDTLSFL